MARRPAAARERIVGRRGQVIINRIRPSARQRRHGTILSKRTAVSKPTVVRILTARRRSPVILRTILRDSNPLLAARNLRSTPIRGGVALRRACRPVVVLRRGHQLTGSADNRRRRCRVPTLLCPRRPSVDHWAMLRRGIKNGRHPRGMAAARVSLRHSSLSRASRTKTSPQEVSRLIRESSMAASRIRISTSRNNSNGSRCTATRRTIASGVSVRRSETRQNSPWTVTVR